MAISRGHNPTSLRKDHTPSLTESESARDALCMWSVEWTPSDTVSALERERGRERESDS